MSEDKKNGKQNKTVKPFDPMTLRGVTVRNRIWLPPMDTYSALAQDGKPTPFHYQHYVSRAMGGFGMIIMEATAVAPEGRISPCDLGLWDDGQMDAWRWIVADAKAAGATMAVQLNHAGRKGSTGCHAIGFDGQSVPEEQGGWRTVCPSANAYGSLARPRALSVDEIHTIVGAGKTEGSMDAGNLLKPMLARGELHCIGATTVDEYRKYIEKDPALERRFQPVMVDEPSIEDAISILRGLKERFEVHHGVRISDSALVEAVVLSSRYIPDRQLPDKAIDLIDEAGAMIRTEIDSQPTELDEANRKVMQLEIEREALRKEDDDASKERLGKLENELAELRTRQAALKTQWEKEKADIDRVRSLKAEIEQTNNSIEEAKRAGDLSRASELTYSTLPGLKKELEDATHAKGEEEHLLREEVGPDDIAEIVAKWTGIPVTRLLQSERDKLLKLGDQLHRRVVGQDEAVKAVADAVLRARAGLSDPHRPTGSFLFLGPTGVGKTELSKALAEALFDTEDNIVRIDMSEYMEKFSVSRLVGAPPGYVGFEEGGQLTEAVRRKPYSVVLLDEIEKAHPDVFNILLQVLDDGRLTDSQGHTVDFRNTIIIMTSNIGSKYLLDGIDENGNLNPGAKEEVLNELKNHFRPEFLNRIDETVLFLPLRRDQMSKIVELQLDHLRERLAERKITLDLTPEARNFVADEAYDPVYGARPLKRYVQHNIETPLARLIIAGTIRDGQHVSVGVKNNELVFDGE